jgi:hypothetical protein
MNIIKKRIRPTYQSDWPAEIPTKEALKKKYGDSEDRSDTDRSDWYSIYGSVLSGGDFERYVIGTNSGYFEWSSRRIGKPKIDTTRKSDEETFDLIVAQSWIFNRVVELGWTPALFGQFDREVTRWASDRRSDKAERIGKKYQWIAYYEFLARVSDNFQYIGNRWDSGDAKHSGPWQASYVRNIDPSSLLADDIGNSKKPSWWSPIEHIPSAEMKEKEWIKTADDIPAPEPMLRVQRASDGSSWLVMETHRSFQEPTPLGEERFDRPFKELWYMVRSYLVRAQDADKLIASLIGKNFWERWMPESREETSVLLGEFFWSPAYIFHDTPYRSHNAWTKGDRSQRLIAKVCVTTEEYLKERVYDCSIKDALHIHLPSKTVANGMALHGSGEDGVFCDISDKVIAFDPTVNEVGPHALLMRQEEFEEYLSANNFSFFWTVLGAKQGMHGGMSREEWNGELQISGVYQLVDGDVKGQLTTKFIGRGDQAS